MNQNNNNKLNAGNRHIDLSIKSLEKKALSAIKQINPFFHTIKLSLVDMSYDELDSLFPGKVAVLSYSQKQVLERTGGLYKQRGKLTLTSGNKVLLFFNSDTPGVPQFRLEISTPSVEDLIELHSKTCILSSKNLIESRMSVSSVEYTIDFMCTTSSNPSVGNLYHIFCRNYYVPYAKGTIFVGGKYTGYSHDHDYTKDRNGQNSVFNVEFSDTHVRERKRIKFYERGPDDKKEKQERYWLPENCDRVRFEVTIKREYLKKKGIDTIPDFLIKPNFYSFVFSKKSPLLQFKRFKDRQYRNYKPPTPEGSYNQLFIENNKDECFLEQVFLAKSKGNDVLNDLEDYEMFDKLIEDTKRLVKSYEVNFVSISKKLLNIIKS